jgi:hypothetical protein
MTTTTISYPRSNLPHFRVSPRNIAFRLCLPPSTKE